MGNNNLSMYLKGFFFNFFLIFFFFRSEHWKTHWNEHCFSLTFRIPGIVNQPRLLFTILYYIYPIYFLKFELLRLIFSEVIMVVLPTFTLQCQFPSFHKGGAGGLSRNPSCDKVMKDRPETWIAVAPATCIRSYKNLFRDETCLEQLTIWISLGKGWEKV